MELVERGAVLVAGGVGRLARRVAHGADRPQLVDRERPHNRPLHGQQHTDARPSPSSRDEAAAAVSEEYARARASILPDIKDVLITR